MRQSDPAAARPALEHAVTAARESGQLAVLSQSLSMASIAENLAGDRTSARRLFNEAQVMTAGVDDVPTMLMLLQARAYNGLFESDLDAVRLASSEGVRLCRELGDRFVLENMLMNLGSTSLIAGEPDESKPLYTEALQIARDIDDRFALHYLLDALACHAATRGQVRLSAQLLGAAETVRAGSGASVIPFLAPLVAQAERSAIAALGESRFEAELEAGRRLSRKAAVRLALGEPTHAATSAPDHVGAGLLGKREAEVARLVAEGLTNKQIGARLFISEHTVDSHVRGILNKLGVNSRAQIAAWMAASTNP